MTKADFRGHVAQKIRQHFYKRRPKALSFETPLMQECWLLNLLEKSEAERERFYFQRDRTRKPGAYTGNVLSHKTEKYLKAFVKLPWSAYAFGRLGGCAFGFFMAHLLKGEVFENGRVDVGAKTKGVLFHRALALLGGDLVSLSKTKGDFDEKQQRKRVSEAVEAAQKAVEADACLAHPELWTLCCEQVKKELFEFLNSKSLFPFGAPLQVLTEWSFEEEAELKSFHGVGFEGEEDAAFEKRVLQLKGRLDRFDILDGGAVGVMDYKLGKRGSKNKYKESLLVDDFQLPLYLFALRRRGFQAQRASWVFLREKAHFLLEEWITPEALDEALEEDLAKRLSLEKRGKLNLLNRMEALVSKVERGDFSPVPVDCGYCLFKSACRVSEKTTLQAESL
jgi:ATP-dependent helicase/DNAse subunit B